MHMCRLVGFLTFSALGAQETGPSNVAVTVYGPLLDAVPNAAVTVRLSDWSILREGKSDGSGQFLFPAGPYGWLYVCATAPGLTTGCEITPQSQAGGAAHLDVRLFEAATVRGTVRDEKGNPIAGAQVIGCLDFAPLMLFKGRPEQAVTDTEGRFEIPHVPLGEVAVRASAADHELGEARVDLTSDAKVDVVCKRGKGRALVVTVEGVPPERLPDIVCQWFISRKFPEPQLAVPLRLAQATFVADGTCTVEGLPRDCRLSMIRLEAVGMRFQPQWQEAPARQDGRVTFRLDAITGPRPMPQAKAFSASEPGTDRPTEPTSDPAVPLVPTAVPNPTMRGVLRDSDGKPSARTRVRIYSDRTGWREAVTADDGSFATDAKYELGDRLAFELQNPDWVLVDRSTEDAWPGGAVWKEYQRGASMDLVMSAAAKVHGTVRSSIEQAIAGYRVLLEVEANGARLYAGSAMTDARGGFTIDGLSPVSSNYWLSISELRGTAETGPFKLESGKTLEGLVLDLKRAFEVAGTVIRNGKGIPGARVYLAAKGTIAGIGGDAVLADAKGRFVFSGVKEGEYSVEVQVHGLTAAGKSKPFDVGAKGPTRREVSIAVK